MQRKNQTQHSHLLLRYEAVLSCEFIFEALFLLIIFRPSSPHHLIKVFVFWRLFQPSSPPLPTAVQNQEGYSWVTEGHFIHTVLSCCLQVLPADNPILPFLKISSSEKNSSLSRRNRNTLFSLSFFCRSKEHNDISDAVAKWLSLLTIYTTTKELAERNCPATASSQLASLSYSRYKEKLNKIPHYKR